MRTETGPWLPLLCLAALSCSAVASAQRIEALGPEVRKYVRVGTSKVILEHVQVIDGTGTAPSPDRNVLIEGGKITAIVPGANQSPSDGTTILDLRGYSVMPGIVGMHDHLFYLALPDLAADYSFDAPALFHQMSFSAPRLYLANGVTTARTAGSVDPYTDLRLKQVIETGALPGPHLDVTGPYPQARQPQPPPTIAATVDREISTIEKLVVEAAEAMPEGKFNFSPESLNVPGSDYKGVRTFAVQVKHVAASNYFLWSPITGDKLPEGLKDGNGPENLKAKADIIKFVKDSFALGHKAAAALTTENMLQIAANGRSPRLYLATFAVAHAYDHYGQMVEYLRMSGIVPPASRGKSD